MRSANEIIYESQDKVLEDKIPQPAGRIVADWYREMRPDETQMLYMIAVLVARLQESE